MEQVVTIELFGQPFTFKTESGVADAKEVADYLVKEVSRIEAQLSKQSTNVDKLATLALAALNIANDNIMIRKDHANLKEDISNRSESIIRILNAAFA